VEVRTVDPSDVELCARLGRMVLAAYVTLPGHVPEPEYEAQLADVAARAAMADTVVLAAFDPEPVGCVTYVAGGGSPMAEHDDAGAASFRMLGVDPAAQGRGAGAALVTACIDRARAEGRAAIVLHTTTWMHTAHRMYERFGFQRDPSLDSVPVPEVSLLGYRLTLDR
jgi:GNAT superfamily N-acetyltransferase